MRKIIAYLLVLSIFYQCAGYILVFNTNFMLCKKEMKRKIKAGLSEAELTYFTFSHTDFENLDWIHSKEFRYQNRMYDVVKKFETENDSVKIACINDEQESRLFANLNEHINSFSDIQKDGKPSTKILLKLLKIQAITNNSVSSYVNTFKIKNYFPNHLFIEHNWVKASNEPPEIVRCTEYNVHCTTYNVL